MTKRRCRCWTSKQRPCVRSPARLTHPRPSRQAREALTTLDSLTAPWKKARTSQRANQNLQSKRSECSTGGTRWWRTATTFALSVADQFERATYLDSSRPLTRLVYCKLRPMDCQSFNKSKWSTIFYKWSRKWSSLRWFPWAEIYFSKLANFGLNFSDHELNQAQWKPFECLLTLYEWVIHSQ